MLQQVTPWVRAGVLVTLLLAVAGCESDGDGFLGWGKKPKPKPKPEPLPQTDRLRQNTVGTLAFISDTQPMQIKGFGLVVGLDGRGSSDCAASIRQYMTEHLTKLIAGGDWRYASAGLSADQLINSLDTAVVELTAQIPPGAPRGTRMDVFVTAATGTQTRSLEGGLLLLSEMKMFAPAEGAQGFRAGRTLAYARGPLVTSPFASGDRGAPLADPRRAIILGGGFLIDERPLRLVLKSSSYADARRIQQRLNERFGTQPPTADALSQAFLVLHTPPHRAYESLDFARLAAHVYLNNQPSYLEMRLQELGEAALAPGNDRETIALLWQAMGRVAIPFIRPLYASEDDELVYYASRTGVALNDPLALSILAEIARRPGSPHRFGAIETMGSCSLPQAPVELLPLLHDEDAEIRIAAFEALLRQRSPAIRSLTFRHRLDERTANFTLDLVETDAAPLIYARRSRWPRIVIMDPQMPLITPLFYTSPDGRLMMTADEGDEDIKLMVRIVPGGPLEEFSIPTRVVDLVRVLAERPDPDEIGRPMGAGLTYSQVLQVLTALAADGTLTAPVIFERSSLRQLLGPEEPTGRPETDEEAFDGEAFGEGALLPEGRSLADDMATPPPDLTEPE